MCFCEYTGNKGGILWHGAESVSYTHLAVSHLAPESGEELNFRMIPFHSLDQEGVLPGFLPDRIMIEHGKDHFECRGYLGLSLIHIYPGPFHNERKRRFSFPGLWQ